MKRVVSALLFLACLFACLGSSSSQQATVIHGASVRSDPSTKNPPIGHLNKNSAVTLLAAKPEAGFYHVKTADGTEGWVGVNYLEVETEGSGPSGSIPASTNPTPDADLLNLLFAARTKAVGQPLVENGREVCGPEGDATPAKTKALNDNKNRTDVPSSYVTIGWDQLKTLPTNRVNDLQGAAVSVVGYLSHRINVESKGTGESTNCHLLGDNEVDWHIYLTKASAQGIADAVVVETTPRTRPAHKWTTDMLAPLVDGNTPVRISGWLLYDSEHISAIGTQRATVWEVHPITRIEVQRNGQWVDLDGGQ